MAGWCILYAFRLLPGFFADTTGLLVCTAVGAVAYATRLRTVIVTLLIAGAVLVLVIAETPIAGWLAAGRVRTDRMPETKLDALVVTSAGVNPNGTMNGEALDHLLTGLELVRAGRSDVLVTTTVEEEFPAGKVVSSVDQARVIQLVAGIPSWLRTAQAESTREEAVNSAALLLPRRLRRIGVVAAPMHTSRACAAFEAVGFAVTCIPARARAPGGGWTPGPWPEDRLTVFGDWVYEVLGTAEYRARGWLKLSAG
ncbi:MAG TPA: ElyC/SanA/YdcF family protein [Gemmatimonadaceae bacterium]|nr:ElyC/SanA/YdcF family protein [Gemmatimonadaceae bacterium]